MNEPLSIFLLPKTLLDEWSIEENQLSEFTKGIFEILNGIDPTNCSKYRKFILKICTSSKLLQESFDFKEKVLKVINSIDIVDLKQEQDYVYLGIDGLKHIVETFKKTVALDPDGSILDEEKVDILKKKINLQLKNIITNICNDPIYLKWFILISFEHFIQKLKYHGRKGHTHISDTIQKLVTSTSKLLKQLYSTTMFQQLDIRENNEKYTAWRHRFLSPTIMDQEKVIIVKNFEIAKKAYCEKLSTCKFDTTTDVTLDFSSKIIQNLTHTQSALWMFSIFFFLRQTAVLENQAHDLESKEKAKERRMQRCNKSLRHILEVNLRETDIITHHLEMALLSEEIKRTEKIIGILDDQYKQYNTMKSIALDEINRSNQSIHNHICDQINQVDDQYTIHQATQYEDLLAKEESIRNLIAEDELEGFDELEETQVKLNVLVNDSWLASEIALYYSKKAQKEEKESSSSSNSHSIVTSKNHYESLANVIKDPSNVFMAIKTIFSPILVNSRGSHNKFSLSGRVLTFITPHGKDWNKQRAEKSNQEKALSCLVDAKLLTKTADGKYAIHENVEQAINKHQNTRSILSLV